MNDTKIEKQLADLEKKIPSGTYEMCYMAGCALIFSMICLCIGNYSADSSPFYSEANRYPYIVSFVFGALSLFCYMFRNFFDATKDGMVIASEILWCNKALTYLKNVLHKREVLRWRSILIAIEIQRKHELDKKNMEDLRAKKAAAHAIFHGEPDL